MRTGYCQAGAVTNKLLPEQSQILKTNRRPNCSRFSLKSPSTCSQRNKENVLGRRGKALSIVLSLIAATAFALQGYDRAVMNGLVTLPTFLKVFPSM